MESRNRTVLLVLIAVVIVVAVFSSFGLNLFGTTDEVRFPGPAPTSGAPGPDQSGQPTDSDRFVRVEVTPATVQSVIEKTLSRPVRYSREVTVSTYRADGTEDAQVSRVTAADGWTRTETDLPNGEARYTVVGDGMVYRWYSWDREARSWPADDHSADVEGQRIFTYEDVLALDPAVITDAGYETRGGWSCVYVEVAQDDLGYRDRYWISVENGLLVEAEITEGERVLYRMTTSAVEQSVSAVFALPDGAVLYKTD